MITLENDELIFRFPEVQLLRKGSSANALTTWPLVGVGSLDRRRRDVRSLHGSAYGARAGAPDVRGRLLDDVASLVPIVRR
jgi:hypothetical protein